MVTTRRRPPFVESVRRHGVLQPLLVRSRGGRFQVMAGSKRLAAALEAGLSEVPCLVERVDDEQARALAAATNVPSSAREASPAIRPERPKPDFAFGAFADCLTAVASSADLLSSGSALTQAVAVDLVRAEAARALHLLKALRVLRGEVSPLRSPLYPRAVLQRVVRRDRRRAPVARGVADDRSEPGGRSAVRRRRGSAGRRARVVGRGGAGSSQRAERSHRLAQRDDEIRRSDRLHGRP